MASAVSSDRKNIGNGGFQVIKNRGGSIGNFEDD